MSNTSKMLMWLVVLVIIVGGIWYFTRPSAAVSPATDTTQTSQTTGATQSGTTGSSVTTVTTVTTTSPTPASDTSDSAINQDAANVDGQMDALDADNSSADAGLNNPSQ